jgi:hypothetical protein
MDVKGRVMTHRIHVDGIRLEGDEAKRLIDDVLSGERKGQWRGGATFGLLASCIVTSMLASCGVGLVLGLTRGGQVGYSMAAEGIIAGPVAAACWFPVYLRMNRKRTRAAMRAQGYELCLECGYWLKGLPADAGRCPECGAARSVYEDVQREGTGEGGSDGA